MYLHHQNQNHLLYVKMDYQHVTLYRALLAIMLVSLLIIQLQQLKELPPHRHQLLMHQQPKHQLHQQLRLHQLPLKQLQWQQKLHQRRQLQQLNLYIIYIRSHVLQNLYLKLLTKNLNIFVIQKCNLAIYC